MNTKLSPAQLEALQSYDYPGNIRELKNLLERAYVLEINDYSELIRQHKEINAALLPQDKIEIPDKLEDVIRMHVKRVCEKCSQNKSEAARRLGITRNTMRKYLQ